jgi:hypothetical protein
LAEIDRPRPGGIRVRNRGVADAPPSNRPWQSCAAALKLVVAKRLSFIVEPSPFTYQQRTHRFGDEARSCGNISFHTGSTRRRFGAYGPDYTHIYRRASTYVARILKGAMPADLPVQEPVKFDLIINLRKAKELSLTIPHRCSHEQTDLVE